MPRRSWPYRRGGAAGGGGGGVGHARGGSTAGGVGSALGVGGRAHPEVVGHAAPPRARPAGVGGRARLSLRDGRANARGTVGEEGGGAGGRAGGGGGRGGRRSAPPLARGVKHRRCQGSMPRANGA